MANRPFVVGVTGLPGSGKSRCAAFFAEQRGVLIDADRLGHAVLAEKAVVQELTRRFGAEICADGIINRKKLGALVFSSGRLEELNAVSHPRLAERIRAELATGLPAGFYYVLDAAILFEAGWHELCDLTLLLDCPFAQRLQRVASRGWSAAELTLRDRSQDEEKKRRLADLILDGSKDLEDLRKKVLELDAAITYNTVLRLAPAKRRDAILQSLSRPTS